MNRYEQIGSSFTVFCDGQHGNDEYKTVDTCLTDYTYNSTTKELTLSFIVPGCFGNPDCLETITVNLDSLNKPMRLACHNFDQLSWFNTADFDDNPGGENQTKLRLAEYHIYGSEGHGRFATWRPDSLFASSTLDTNAIKGKDSVYHYREKTQLSRNVGEKEYEVKDHLGNIRMTFSDQKVPVDVTDLSLGWELSMQTASNYYPFGMQMLGMAWKLGDGYRYGFNGMEKDDEIYGNGNSYTTMFRQYDPRLGRWLSLDPKRQKHPSWSPYTFAFNNPIRITDPLGDDPPYRIEEGVIKGDGVVHDITNSTKRPQMKVITAVVLHRTVSSSASSAITTTKKHKGKTGFHIVVDKDGTITQVNNLDNRANHVGKQKQGVGNMNSIGIEVVGMPIDSKGSPTMVDKDIVGWEGLTDEQVENTAQALNTILHEYDLGLEDVYPHEDVSWKTEGEGQVVLDAIQERVGELYDQSQSAKQQENKKNVEGTQGDDLHDE